MVIFAAEICETLKLLQIMADEMKTCPRCESPYGYPLREELYACPECGNEWNPTEVEAAAAAAKEEEERFVVRDANGNELQDGDSVIVIKDLPVRGAPKPVKAGTLVRNIRLVDEDHDISCRIDGFGQMGLKSEFVRRA